METILSEKYIIEYYKLMPNELKIAASSYFQFLVNNFKQENKNTDSNKTKRELGGLEGKIVVPEDFNEPLEDFEYYM